MKKVQLTILSILISSLIFAQNNHIIGKVEIQLNEGLINENITITNLPDNRSEIEFALHEALTIKDITCSNNQISYKIDSSRKINPVNIYRITCNNSFKSNDSLNFIVSGKFDIYDENNKYLRSSGLDMASNYSIFRANGLSSWYPTLVDIDKKPYLDNILKSFNKYSLEIECKDCEYIQIGDLKPQDSTAFFNSDFSPLFLTAGNYKWSEIDNSIFINLDSEKQEIIEKATKKIINYYESLINEPYSGKPFFVNLNVDFNSNELSYCYPTILTMTKKGSKFSESISSISHELAHYYFAIIYKPKSNLYWFYLEAFAEYFSIKYDIESNNTFQLKNNYFNFRMVKAFNFIPFLNKFQGIDIKFVRLDKVKDKEEVHGVQRYIISPFQLIGIEHEIGEENMIKFIKTVFANISNEEDGYITMINSLKEINIDDKTIKKIEKNYIRRFKMRKYKFFKENFK